MKLLYSSSNGDRWFLVEGAERSFVRHEPNLSSGGLASETDVDEFLSRGNQGPEHDELRRHLERASSQPHLVDMSPLAPDSPRGPAARPITAAQIRGGRGLLGWSQEALAREAHLSVAELASCESGQGAPRYDHMERIARSLGLGGVVLLAEGEVSTGGPGVRMGALGTSTGQPVEKTDAEGNDNEVAREPWSRTLNG